MGDGKGAARRRVLITFPAFDRDAPHGVRLADAGVEFKLAPKLGARSPAEVAELVAGCVGAMVSTDPFDESVFAAAPDLRIVARVGVGYDAIDVDSASRAGVVVTTTPGANEETVADHTLALILAAVRRVAEHDRNMRAGKWDRFGAHLSWELHGKVVGVVGAGAIGAKVIRRLQGFAVRVLFFDPVVDSCAGAEKIERLNDLLRAADVVTLHTPLLPATRGMIGAGEIALMGADAILVNVARGGLVDETALAAALTAGGLRAAGIDVFVDEPPTGSPLFEVPNLVVSPHIGGVGVGSMAAMIDRATASVIEMIEGTTPADALNPSAFASAPARP
jgi:phosphoglycerate dehydrogenase-like enzyme